MKVSACLIAKNEEKNISHCLSSYKHIVDEIILVDTGSTDKTVDIAKEFGAKIYDYEWNDDFASAKNFALQKTMGDWVIFLDADERFDIESAKKIPEILKEVNSSRYNAIGCKIINIDVNKNNKVINSFLSLRIFKRDKNIKYRGNIHEALYNVNGKIHTVVFQDEIIIYHTGYSADINKKKAKRNLDILLDNVNKNGYNPDDYRYLTDCYFSLEDYENAAKYARLHIEKGNRTFGHESNIYKRLIDSLYFLKRPKSEIEKEIKSAISLFPDHPNFYTSYAYFLFDEKRYEDALNNFLLAFRYRNEYSGIEVNLIEGIVNDMYLKVGYIYELKNMAENALTYYYYSLKEAKYNSQTFKSFFKLIQYEDLEQVISLINQIYNSESEEDLQFILNQLTQLKAGNILAYYTNIWYKKFGKQDSSLAFMLLAKQRYDTTFQIFFDGYRNNFSRENAIFSILSALMANNENNIKLMINCVKPSFGRILKGMIFEGVQLIFSDMDDYCAILRELILIDKEKNIVKSYIKLRESFTEDTKAMLYYEMGKIFQEYSMYEEALVLYQGCLNEINDDRQKINMLIGYCYYRLRNYRDAYNYLKKAIEDGYMENDIKEFLQWIQEQSNEEGLRHLVEDTIKRLDQFKIEKGESQT